MFLQKHPPASQWNCPAFASFHLISSLIRRDRIRCFPWHSVDITGSPSARGGAAANPGFREILSPCFLTAAVAPHSQQQGQLVPILASWIHDGAPSRAQQSSPVDFYRSEMTCPQNHSTSQLTGRQGHGASTSPEERQMDRVGERRRRTMMKALRAAGSAS